MHPRSKSQRSSIAVICAVKNRSGPLRYTIPTWLWQTGVEQLVLIDWDSHIPLWDDLDSYDIPHWPDPRVTIIRAVDQPFWNMGKAINLGMSVVRQPLTFKVDADVAIVDDLNYRMPESGKSFVSGNYATARKKNKTSLLGTAFFNTDDFKRINGYDERFTNYGWEDSNLHQRLLTAGCAQYHFEYNQLFHLPHSDRKRYQHIEAGRDDSETGITANRLADNQRAPWSADHRQTEFEYSMFEPAQKRYLAYEKNN